MSDSHEFALLLLLHRFGPQVFDVDDIAETDSGKRICFRNDGNGGLSMRLEDDAAVHRSDGNGATYHKAAR